MNRKDFNDKVICSLAEEIKTWCKKEHIPQEMRAIPDIDTVYVAQFSEKDLVRLAESLMNKLETISLVSSLTRERWF